MAGVGAIAWTGWVTGIALGALRDLDQRPHRWGVDFAMPAMFTALLVAPKTGTSSSAARRRHRPLCVALARGTRCATELARRGRLDGGGLVAAAVIRER